MLFRLFLFQSDDQMDEGMHPPLEGDLGLAKNYRGITITSIAAKIYYETA